MNLTLTNGRVDEEATQRLRRAKLRARGSGDLNGAVLSAAYYAKKQGRLMYLYEGNSYGWRVWRATWKESDALDPINNTGSRVLTVSPDLIITTYDVVRERTTRAPNVAALRESLKQI